jgi:predicted ATPase
MEGDTVGGTDNPYAAALDGLVLDDPVRAFFDFCRERERIRERRERGDSPPWSDDPIFQQGRFLNVFREDDRGTRALLGFVGRTEHELPDLIHALFFARWCNSQTTLDALTVGQLSDSVSLQQTLMTLPDQPWSNVAAYPVEPVEWEGRRYSRLDTATKLFGQIKHTLAQLIVDSAGDVVRATHAINQRFKMKNDFPIFMAVMDVAWFRPEVIDPASHVPTGIGAVAFLDRLQRHLGCDSHEQTCAQMIALQSVHWPDAKRAFQPIDIEYLSCECRKYYSYVNGTKVFEGKNVFRAGESASLEFDVDASGADTTPIQTEIHVIAGGPCSGKTTILQALQERGYPVEVETSERLLEAGIAQGQTSAEIRADPVQWQQRIFKEDHRLFDSLPTDALVFTDTSFIEDVVFGGRAGIVVGPNIGSWLRTKRYKKVFFLDPLQSYEQSQVRMESHAVARRISEQVRECYREHGYEPVVVPSAPVGERLALILSHIDAG